MKDSPKVSVIIPTYNRGKLLERAIKSVLNQTYHNFRIIIVDDASRDDISLVVRKFDDQRITFLQHKVNKGTAAARNTGLREVEGEYIAFLDSDDKWISTKLKKQVEKMEELPSCYGLIYSWMDYFEQGNKVREYHPTLRGYIVPHTLDKQPIGGCPTLLVRREVVENIGGFDERLLRGNDGDFIRRIALYYKVDFIPEVLVRVHIGHGNERITREDQQGIRNALRAQKVKLEKFLAELEKFPKQKANVYALIAYRYAQLGNWREFFKWYSRSLSVYPFSKIIYIKFLASLKSELLNFYRKLSQTKK